MKCIVCGEEIDPFSSRTKYCSDFCYRVNSNINNNERNKAASKLKPKKHITKLNCKECGNEFDKTVSNKIFCTYDCSKIFHDKAYLETRKQSNFEIFVQDKFKCRYCGLKSKDGELLVVDHIYPVSKGGGADRFNLVTACTECNLQKSSKLLPKEIILELWEDNAQEFTYKWLKEFFKKDLARRRRLLGISKHSSMLQ